MALRFKVMAALLALLWLPMVSHCSWEHMSGLEYLGCCSSAAAGPHQNDDCETVLCASVESGHYKTEQRFVKAPAPALLATPPATQLTTAGQDPASAPVRISSVLLEVLHCWQFACRTAAPPRAPSFGL